ncbi:MAG: virulence RhuM family protein [Bacilli bacterium]|nr:virulence RhuM family protein [Bacilli bacterium]
MKYSKLISNLEKVIFTDGDFQMEIDVEKGTNEPWLSLNELAYFYSKDKSDITRHLNQRGTKMHLAVAKNAPPRSDGKVYKTSCYNLETIIEIGYRVNSKRGQKLKAFLDNCFDSNLIEISNEIIIYNNGDVSIDVRISPQENTVWVSQDKIAKLYDSSKQVVSYHIKNILDDEELDRSVVKEILTTGLDGKTYSISYYNLDMVISIGYRINSKKGIAFRKWAASTLKEYLMKGYLVNKERTLITSENYLNLVNKVDSLENRMDIIEEKQNHLFIEDKVIYEGTVFDAIVLINKLIEISHSSIVLIDPYIDVRTLDAFKSKERNIMLFIITSSNNRLSEKEKQAFIKQYGRLNVFLDDRYHDRYLILDKTYFYHLGTSINYLGKHFSQITLVVDEDIKDVLHQRIRNYFP